MRERRARCKQRGARCGQWWTEGIAEEAEEEEEEEQEEDRERSQRADRERWPSLTALSA